MPPRDTWRDVAAAYLVHYGLRLATRTGRNRMLHALSDEWRAAVGATLVATLDDAARRERERLARPRPASEPAGCRPIDGP